MSDQRASTAVINLQALDEFLDGGELPGEMAMRLRWISTLPTEARPGLAAALAPSLTSTPDDEAAETITRFCEQHSIGEPDLRALSRATRALIRRAVDRKVTPDAFVDLLTHAFEDEELIEWLARTYAVYSPALRNETLARTLGEHGETAIGVDWRVDTVRASQHGENIDTAVVFLTFRTVKGNEERRITLQLMPDMLAELHRVCERLLG